MKSYSVAWLGAVLMCMNIHAAETPTSYQTVLSKAEVVAAQYRQLAEDSAEREILREKVEKLVEQSFDLRQLEQADRLEQLKKQLAEAERSIAQRSAIRDRIIKRKAEDLLDAQSADWQASATSKSEAFETISIGDTVAVVVDGVLPMSSKGAAASPPVNVLPTGQIVTGFPFVVAADGAISLPLIGNTEIEGLSVREAEEKITAIFVSRDIMRPDRARVALTLVGRIVNDASLQPSVGTSLNPELNVVAAPVNYMGQAGMPISGRPLSGAEPPSFQDTYGILQLARQGTQGIRAAQQKLTYAKTRLKARQEFSLADQELFESTVRTSSDAIAEHLFQLRLQRDFLRDNLDELKQDWELSRTLLQPLKRRSEMILKLHETGQTTRIELDDIRTECLKQESKVEIAWNRVSRYEKIYSHWKEIVGDQLDEPGEKQQVEPLGK